MSTIIDPYGFIYITTNNLNGKRYIGQRIFDNKGNWKYYFGSGVALKDAIKKYGRENFSKEIIYIAYSKEELDKAEINLIEFLNASNSIDYYNISLGGDGYSPKQKCRAVYCIDLKRAFKNSNIASKVTQEPEGTIFNKCKNYHNKKRNIKKGYHWCFLEDMYSIFNNRSCSQAHPVVYLKNGTIYASSTQANKIEGYICNRRSVLTEKTYIKFKEKGWDLSNKLIYLYDYLQLFEYTE